MVIKIRKPAIQQDAKQILARSNDFGTEITERFERLVKRLHNLDHKAHVIYTIDDAGPWGYYDLSDIPYTCRWILKGIKVNLHLIRESRFQYMSQGLTGTFEAPYNRLEIAFYKLKVDVESYMRIHQLEK